MNKIYRVIWSAVSQQWVTVSELATARGKSGGRSAVVAGMLMLPILAMAQDFTLGSFDPHTNDHQVGAVVVNGGATANLTGSLGTVLSGSNGDHTYTTLQALIDEGKVSGALDAIGAMRLSTFAPDLNITVEDPATGSKRTVTVIDNKKITELTPVLGNQLISLGLSNVAQYVDLRLGTVDSTGGTLNIDLANGPTSKTLVAKQTALVLADGHGQTASNVNWSSKNTFNFDAGQVADAPEGQFAVTLVAKFPTGGTLTAYDGSQFQMQSITDLKAYNSWLIAELEAGRLDQAQYTNEFYKSFTKTTEYIKYELPPGSATGEITEDRGLVNVIRASGANATGTLASSGALTVDRGGGSLGGIMRADQGGNIVNNGTISLVRTTGGQYDGNAFVVSDEGSQGINNGTINTGFTLNNDGGIAAVSISYAVGARTSNNARFENGSEGVINVAVNTRGDGGLTEGLRADSKANASNSGAINVGVNGTTDNLYGVVGARVLGGAVFVNEQDGLIYIGRGPQTHIADETSDVALTTAANGVVAGISVENDGFAENIGEIVIGTQTQRGTAMRSMGTGNRGSLTNSGTIEILGAMQSAAPAENIGMAAINAMNVTNTGTINVGKAGELVVNSIAMKAYDPGGGASRIISTGQVNMNGDAALDRRNYGAWAQGDKAEIALNGGSVNLNGDGAIGVHAREAGKIVVDGGTVNFSQGESQIGFFAYGTNANGKASTIDIKSSPATGLEVSTAGSTLFRIEDGAKIINSVGARLIASGERSTALQVTGVGSTINLDGADITVSGEGATALKLEGGAAGQMSGAARLVLKDGSTAVVVDNTKHDLTGKAVGAAQSIFTNYANVEVTNATDVTAFVVRNGGQLINAGDIHLSHGTAIEVVGKGSTVVAGAKAGKITVDDGVAGIHVHGGASLSTADTITVDGGASGILVGADAGSVVVTEGASITGLGAGYGNLITNKATAATTLVDGAVLEMRGSGAALLTENNLDETSHGTIVVSSLRGGKGIALSIEDGGVTNGSLTVGDAWKIDVTGNGAGVYANTTGDLMVNSQSLTLSGDGGNAIRIDAAKQVTVGAGARLSTENANAVLIEGNPQTLRNNGQIAAASASAVAVALDDQGHTFINGGTGKVTGIVSLGNGRNAATLEAGSQLEGTLLGGSGDDTVTVEGDAKFTQVDGGAEGDNLLVFDGAHYSYADADAIHNFDRVQLTGNSTVALERALTVAKDGSDNAAVEIYAGSTLAVVTGEAFVLNNPLSGKGTVSTSTGGQRFDFGAANGTSLGADFSGKLSVGHSTFDLSGTNTRALGSATLEAGQDSLISVGDGTQQIGGLAFAGGTVVFNASIPEQTVASSVIKVDVLDASGEGQIRVTVPAPYVPSVPDTPNTANLLEQDDGMIGVKLVEAQSIIGSGGGLELQDQNGQKISDKREVDISQGSEIVAKGTYDFRLTSAPGDGLYVNYGLTEMDLQAGKTLSLAQDHDKKGAAADMSAKLTGEGNLAIDAGNGTLSVSNTRNDYAGETTVRSGTLRLDADGALGQTSALYISDNATTNLNGRTQTIGLLNSHAGSTLDVNNGTLTIANGGLSAGSLTGAGQINVAGGLLEVQGANADLSSRTNIAQSATVQINDTLGLGTGVIANDGTLDLNGATGALTNVISGRGAVNLISGANVSVTGDNSVFSGQFATAESASLTVAEAKHLGEAKLVNEGQLVVDTATDWILANTVSGNGDLIKQGAGTLTAGDALTYAGKTAINAGAVIVGDVSQPNINLGGVGAGEVAVKQGAILAGQGTVQGVVSNAGTISALNTLLGYETAAASTFTLAGGLINSGIINLAGGQVGNRLLVKSDYVGQNGTVVLNTYMGDDSSATDKLIFDGGAVTGNTNLVFKHAGGDGAQTQQGIRVVETQNGATTTAEAFVLDARSDGYRQGVGTLAHGAYDYRLARGGNGGETEDWYLVSAIAPTNPPPPEEKIGPPEAELAPRQPPSVSEPVYRPEVGGYLANRQAALNRQVHTLRERQAQAPGVGGNGGEPSNNSWFRIAGSQTDWDANGLTGNGTEQVVHFGSDVARFSAGANGKVHLGVMGQYSRHTGSVDNGWLSASHKADGVSGGVYGTWYGHQDELSGPYIDTWLMYGRFNNQVQGQGLSGESYHSQVFTGSVEGGYSFKIDERPGAQVYLQPQVQLIYSDYRADDHKESTGTMISGQSMGTVLARLGVRLQGDFQNEAKQTRMRPFAELNWWYNNRGSQGMNFDAQQVSLDLPSQYGEFKVGLQGNLSKRLEVWGSAGVKTDMSSFTKGSLQGGVKYNW
ncbi:autotransporter outer membrane beta-barrel domain-containing protein [Chromobacterium haemolyticum]|uniref:autotransporter outer membrane beta-barrel domain-containing protein n=1 Tax=Chromobacterium haemolyticum TaxID=394935 RepID=UPI001318CDB5|nr:autotransporter outer membrane beta-barrel domain-containing protein [Chromobacterium haemolyticum]BBH12263.1 outer membrane autotransporter barrel domain-containing protein [Chromobacterium haemolyticum]